MEVPARIAIYTITNKALPVFFEIAHFVADGRWRALRAPATSYPPPSSRTSNDKGDKIGGSVTLAGLSRISGCPSA